MEQVAEARARIRSIEIEGNRELQPLTATIADLEARRRALAAELGDGELTPERYKELDEASKRELAAEQATLDAATVPFQKRINIEQNDLRKALEEIPMIQQRIAFIREEHGLDEKEGSA